MKKRHLLLSLITAFAFCFAGCSTTGGKITVQDVTPGIKAAAFGGTFYALKEHPEWHDGFAAASADLKILETAETIDFPTILAIVSRLPVKELQSQEARIAITGANILLAGYGNRIIELDKLENLRPIAAAIRQGIDLGLQ